LIIIANFSHNSECAKYVPRDGVSERIDPYLNSETGYWTFRTDRDFIIMQLTDIHIENIKESEKADKKALDAIETLVKRINPDLIIITGDISNAGDYDAEFRQAEQVANLLDEMKVYWTVTFGNHETGVIEERKKLGDFYESHRPYCLFQKGGEGKGVGNAIINIENLKDRVVQSLVLIDSNGGLPGGGYENIDSSQIEWYESAIQHINEINSGEVVKSLMFLHIPLQEYKTALLKYAIAGARDTSDVQWLGGAWGEWPAIAKYPDDMFETIKRLNSTKAVFCGHDHFNYFGIRYKEIELVYGMSIDYWAYAGGRVMQRGATVITIHSDGTHEHHCSRLLDLE
jgi:3',5'-cyclic AMP phosphodiesterase CpdA